MSIRPDFSFANWQSDHPSDRIPGDRIDNAFGAQARALDELHTKVDKLLRADGKLNHDLLTVDSFPPQFIQRLQSEVLAGIQSAKAELAVAVDHVDSATTTVEQALADVRVLVQQVSADLGRAISLAGEIVSLAEDFRARAAQAEVQAKAVDSRWTESENAATLTLAAAENWADVSMEWAEHMPDTIPPNILATNAVTGDHWSSRWWANRAASYVGGMLYHYYLGPSATPPFSTPTGDPLQEGMIYLSTSDGMMYVYTGGSWHPFATPQPAGVAALNYLAVAGQTVFPLTVADLTGKSITLNQSKNEGVVVYLNGSRLVPSGGSYTGDYSVTKSSSTVTLSTAPGAGAIVAVDVLRDPTDLLIGAVAVTKLKTFPVDGIAVTFPLLYPAGGAVPVVSDASQLTISVDGVNQEPGVDFSLSGAGTTITFAVAPAADSLTFGVYYYRG